MWVEDLQGTGKATNPPPDISKYKKITLQMFRWGLLVAGVAGAWAGVMVFVSGSNDSMLRRITLYYMFREILFKKAIQVIQLC